MLAAHLRIAHLAANMLKLAPISEDRKCYEKLLIHKH